MREKNKQKILSSNKDFFEKGMKGHNAVLDIINIGDDLYLIKRTNNRKNIKLKIADIYIAGEADIYEITSDNEDIDCIVLIGFYNKYSIAAKQLATKMNIALFINREFFGAINCVGQHFINYEKKE